MDNYVLIVRLLIDPEGSQIMWPDRVILAIGFLVDLNFDVWRLTLKPPAATLLSVNSVL